MNRAGHRDSPPCVCVAILVSCLSGAAIAENVDPTGDGSQYAWGENIGWLNAESQGEGGPGVTVSDTELTGWIWTENHGWISLSCQNTSSCGANDYVVTNDGKGNLSGFAWGEHLGWINFRTSGGSDCCSSNATPGCTDSVCEAAICPSNPSCCNDNWDSTCAGAASAELACSPSCAADAFGVRIHGFTGEFSGYAWTEHDGWINFGTAPVAQDFQIETAWRCSDPDTDGVCSASDSCALDPDNDIDGDGICAGACVPGPGQLPCEDTCPTTPNGGGGVIYAVDGASETASTLYVIDPTTGSAQTVGPTGFSHVTGLAIHPTTGVLYGVTGDFLGELSALISIDPSTGVGTLIGLTDLSNVPDITFSSTGVLHAWGENFSNLYTIDLGTGAASLVGVCACGTTHAVGLAFDTADALYMKAQNQLHLMDAALGTIISTVTLSEGPNNLLAFDPAGVLYTGSRGGGMFTLQTIDRVTGQVTDVGTNSLDKLSAIAFSPTQSDLDGDGLGDVCDSCPGAPNVGGGLSLFTTVTAQSKSVFQWPIPSDHKYVRGSFADSTDIAGYPFSAFESGLTGTTTEDLTSPSSGQGFWYLWAPECPGGSYSSGGAAEQGDRDGSLP